MTYEYYFYILKLFWRDNMKNKVNQFKNSLKEESIDELLEDRKIYCQYLNKDQKKYKKYIGMIEQEIKDRLKKYGML